jgi:hypothetical protein
MVIKRRPIKKVDDDNFEAIEGAATDRENHLNAS